MGKKSRRKRWVGPTVSVFDTSEEFGIHVAELMNDACVHCDEFGELERRQRDDGATAYYCKMCGNRRAMFYPAAGAGGRTESGRTAPGGLDELHAAALRSDAPGAWIRAAIEAQYAREAHRGK